MTEASKIRLVRCPKCENLLQELPAYSVYECGGCGTLLRAKKKASASDGFLEKSNEEKSLEGVSKLENVSEECNLGNLSEIEREDHKVEFRKRNDKVLGEPNVSLVSISSSRTEDKQVSLGHEDINAKEDSEGLKLGQSNSKTKIRYVDKPRKSLMHQIDAWVGGDDQENLIRCNSATSSVVKGIGEVSAESKNSARVMNSRVVMDKSGVERVGFWGFDEDPQGVPGHGRSMPSAYPDEGPSNYKPNAVYRDGKPMKNSSVLDRPNMVDNVELDRPELLRKLNALKEQISILEEKPREIIPDDKKMAPPESYGGRATINVSMQASAWGNQVPKSPNFNHGRRSALSVNDHNLDMHSFYLHQMHAPSTIPGSNYEDPFRPQVLRGLPNQPTFRYPPQQPLEYFTGHYMDFNHDHLASCSQEPFLPPHACSCLHCYNKNWQVPPTVPGTGFSNRRVSKDQLRSNSYHHTNPAKFGLRNYGPPGAIPPTLHFQDPQPHRHTRWPTDIDSNIEVFYHSRPKRVVAERGIRRFSQPILGGAPFMTCRKCLEFLKLPRKLIKMANNLQKIQCGACSTVHSTEIKNKRLIISVADVGSHDPLNGGMNSYGCSNTGPTNSCSVDFDGPGYNFQSTDARQNFIFKDQMLNLSESEKRQGCKSSSPISTEEENSLDSIIVQRDVSNFSELSSINDLTVTIEGSNFIDCVDDSSSIHAVSSSGNGNRSKGVDQEKVVLNNFATQQSVEKDALTETEVKESFNNFLSWDSVDVSREEDQPTIKKGQKTFLVGLIKKSFRDFSRSNQNKENERPCVSVNGQCIPNRLVKKAEKLAGPIEPGDYWYDFQAGFWGVMGQPCLGIITPFIEEFNYPMPENCAAGNTGVFVNGRELHHIDLDLLAGRGLPNTRDKNYIVEFSGRVVDKDSGEELDSLGKLAPTVEKLKRGFGMRVAKVVL